jgi:hypothetical protein
LDGVNNETKGVWEEQMMMMMMQYISITRSVCRIQEQDRN